MISGSLENRSRKKLFSVSNLRSHQVAQTQLNTGDCSTSAGDFNARTASNSVSINHTGACVVVCPQGKVRGFVKMKGQK